MNGSPRHFFEFDTFRVDVEERRLTQNGKSVTLTAKVFDILLALIESSGRTVEKEELMRCVWEDTFVEEGNLNRHISTLRQLLGDNPREQRFIKTIPKHGYRFTGDVKEVLAEDDVIGVEELPGTRQAIHEEKRKSFWPIARVAIASALLIGVGLLGAWALSIGGPARGKNISMMTANSEAIEAYTKGRDLWRNRRAESLHEATLLLEKAVQKDPNFALGHAALADAYAFDYTNWKKAETEANIAIKLDPGLGEPHASIGFIKMFWQWNLYGAEVEFKQAVALSPDYATGHQWFAANLAATGHGDAALIEIRKAMELEPSSVAIHADQCQMLYFARRNEEALTECRKTLEIDPKFLSAQDHLYDIYCILGMNDEAVNEFFETSGEMLPTVASSLRRAYTEGGIKGFRTEQLEFFVHSNPNYYRLAQTYARLGDIDRTFEALLTSYEKKEFDFVFVYADPVFAHLHLDPRMLDLRRKLLN
jgi:DNA-binding winged helix-turn-helix (wHTH) protein